MSVPHIPSTAAELEELIREGVLVESLVFDAKARFEPGEKANTRLAIDLAAMSVAGGMIAIGVAETGGALIPSPIPLVGLRERVSQVALSRPDPSISPVTRELATQDPDVGYLLVIVPPGPDAPHQVDGKYRGRGDTTNYVMGDAEVRRVQAARARARADIEGDLDRAVHRDPFPIPSNAHLFVVARPSMTSGPAMLLDRIGPDWRAWLQRTLQPEVRRGEFDPNLGSAMNAQRRPDGWALTSGGIGADRTIDPRDIREGELLELEVDEDGALRLFCGRASDRIGSDSGSWTFEELITGLTWSVVVAAAFVSQTMGYVGNWDLGVAITHAQGVASYDLKNRYGGHRVYGGDEYRATTSATGPEIAGRRYQILQRLLGKWNRALTDDQVTITDFDADA